MRESILKEYVCKEDKLDRSASGGALLSYAKKSRVNAARLKAAVSRAGVNESCKSMTRFLAALARLN
jgi:hypothetical protein